MRIQYKLYVAFLLASISLVALMFILMQWSLSKGLVEFVNTRERDSLTPLVAELKLRYQQRGNWDWLRERHRLFHQLVRNYADHSEQIEERPHYLRQGPRTDGHPPERGERGNGEIHFERHPPPRPRPPPRHHDGQANERHGPGPGKDGNFRPRHPKDPGPSHGRPPRPRGSGLPDISLFDHNKQFVVGKEPVSSDDQWVAIKLDKSTVGWLIIPRRYGLAKGYELTLLEKQRFEFLLISLLLTILTILIALPVARNLVQPIKRLAGAMDQLTQGDYGCRIELRRNDELGNLARDVNELAMTLEENESARKRWLANISHELRTPIAVLKSEMEAVIDGIRPLDQEHVGSSHQEVIRLQRLVEDLYELTAADIGGLKYRKEEFDLVAYLKDHCQQYERILGEYDISLVNGVEQGDRCKRAIVWADHDRLTQLFKNLMVNCGKYVDTGGHVALSIRRTKRDCTVIVEDDGKGVAPEHLENLFEHLYRVEDSRNRQTGGSGLGLAICKQIVEAHHGSIHAQKSKLGGLAVVITLPLA